MVLNMTEQSDDISGIAERKETCLAKQKEVIDNVKKATVELVRKYPDKIVAVGLFGSFARGDYTDRSDVDILVIVKDWPGGMNRRYMIYDIFFRFVGLDISLMDLDIEDINELLDGKISLTSSMLNVLYDCIVIYDPYEILQKLVESVKKLVHDLGLARYRIGRAYGWKIK